MMDFRDIIKPCLAKEDYILPVRADYSLPQAIHVPLMNMFATPRNLPKAGRQEVGARNDRYA
jgi:hypothetical protein